MQFKGQRGKSPPQQKHNYSYSYSPVQEVDVSSSPSSSLSVAASEAAKLASPLAAPLAAQKNHGLLKVDSKQSTNSEKKIPEDTIPGHKKVVGAQMTMPCSYWYITLQKIYKPKCQN